MTRDTINISIFYFDVSHHIITFFLRQSIILLLKYMIKVIKYIKVYKVKYCFNIFVVFDIRKKKVKE